MQRIALACLLLVAGALCLPQSRLGGPVGGVAFADDDDGGGRGGGGRGGDRGGRGARGDDGSDGDGFRRQARPPVRRPAPRQRARPAAPRRPVVRAEIVVAGIQPAALDQLAAAGFAVVARAATVSVAGEIARLRAPAAIGLDAARQRILDVAPEAIVDANHTYRTSEFACGAWGCASAVAISWPGAPCTAAPLIGMVDTAVDTRAPALRGQSVEAVSVVSEGRRAADAAHGTAIAALLVGAETSRTPGLLPRAKLLAAEAFHRERSGSGADAFAVARGIDLMVGRRVDVANLSLAGPANAVLERFVRAAVDAGIPLVAAVGNGGAGAAPAYPAAYPGVIAVTAVDGDHKIYRQAGRGAHVAFAAPGVRLWTAGGRGGGRFASGTSYAAPFVTAAVAALRAADPERAPGEQVEALASRVIDLGDPGRDPVFGWGLVQATGVCGAS